MNPFYEEKYQLRSYDFDFQNNLKLSSIFNYMQDTASTHAGMLKFGFEDLYKLNLFWVLSWIKIELGSFPAYGDSIKVKTWPKTSHRLYSLRDFILFDNGGNIFAKSTSAWLLLKSDTKRPVELKSYAVDIPFQADENALADLPEKLVKPNIPPAVSEKRKIKYSDIDINRHVNNAKYIEFIIDSFDEEFLTNRKINSAEVSFLSEVRYGDNIEIEVYSQDDNRSFVSGKESGGGKNIFASRLHWKEI